MKKLKEITKRIATLGLAAALMVNSFPATAFAAEIGDPDLAVVMEEEQQEGGGEILTDESESDAAVSDSKLETDKDAAVSEGDTKEEKDAGEKKLLAFKESRSINGVKITVEAEEGVFPEGAALSVKKVTVAQEKQAEIAVESERDEDKQVAASYTYDIKVLDQDGNEPQPADESKVKVSFKLEEVADSNLETNIYHIKEADPNGTDSGEKAGNDKADSEETSEASGADSDNKVSDNMQLVAEKLTVETDGDTATAETDGFSLYTVEFTYDNKQYILPGDSEVALSEILDTVGLTGEVSDVEVSEESLFSAKKCKTTEGGNTPEKDEDGKVIEDENGTWFVFAHQAFSTEEWMKVTIGGVEYEITVTDTNSNGISYIDASGNEQTASVVTNVDETMDESDTAFISGSQGRFLYVNSDLTLTQAKNQSTVDAYNLILGDGKTLTVDGIMNLWSGLVIYGQSEQTGSLTVNSYLSVGTKDLTVNGGKVTATSNYFGEAAISAKNVTINRGTVTATTSMMSTSAVSGDVTLNGGMLTATAEGPLSSTTIDGGVTLNGGTFYASGRQGAVNGTVKVAEGMLYKDDTDPCNYYFGTLSNAQKAAINGKTLSPEEGNIYAVAIGDVTRGTVTADKYTVAKDATGEARTVTLTLAPETGYSLKTLTVKDTSGNEVAVSGEGDTRTFTMPNGHVTVSAVFALPTVSTGYIDENGTEQTANAVALTGGGATTLDGGWYVVPENTTVSYTGTLKFDGDTHIILADGATLNCGTKSGRINGISIEVDNGGLTVYGQSDQTGRLNAYSNNENTIFSQNSAAFNGGTVTADSVGFCAIMTDYSVTVRRGTVNAVSSEDNTINADEGVTVAGGGLNVTAPDGKYAVKVWSSSYAVTLAGGTLSTTGGTGVVCYSYGSYVPATVKVADGMNYTDGANLYRGTLTDEQKAAIHGKTFTPAYGVIAAEGIEHGTVSASPAAFAIKDFADADKTVTLTVTPDENYTIGTVSYNDGSDHTITPVNGVYSFTMPEKDVTVNATFLKSLSHSDITIGSIAEQTYQGSGTTPSVTVKDGDTTLTEGEDYTLSYSNNINVSESTAANAPTVTVTGKDNYSGTITATFTIKARPVSIKAEAQSVELNGEIATGTDKVEVSSGELVSGHSIYRVTVATENTRNAVGTFDGAITASGALIRDANGNDVTANYNITYTAGTLTVTKVKAKVTTVPTAKMGLIYSGESQTLLDANGGADTAMEYALGSDADTAPVSGYSETVPGGTDAKTYYIWYRAKEDENHEAGNPAVLTVEIAKATPNITTVPTAAAITYGQTLNESTLTGGAATLNETDVNGDFTWSDATVVPQVSDSSKTEYTVKFTPNDSVNFNDATCKVKLIVNKAEISGEDITAPAAISDLSYTGSAQALIIAGSVTGGIGTMYYALGTATEATEPYTTTIPTGTNAGNYSVWYKVKGDGNHNDKETSGPVENISINRKAVTVTANDQSVEVNDIIVTGKDQATLSGGASGHTLRSVSISTSQSTGALGEYPDVIVPASAKINDASGKDVTANYDISYSNGKLTVTNVQVYISGISAENKVYDKTTNVILTGTPVLKRVKNDETVKGLTVSGYTASFADYNAGEDKSVTVSGGTLGGDNASDYTLMTDKTNDKLSLKAGITPKEVSLEWGGTSFTYDGSDHFPAATAGGLIEGDSCTVKVAGGKKDAGSYTATAESLSDRNYKLPADRIKSFTISKAESSVVTAPAAKSGLVYNGNPQALVDPGKANGGTMQYAPGNEEGPAEVYSDLIPESTDAGTYYVWYKVKGDNNHNDTLEEKVRVEIGKADQEISFAEALITLKKGESYFNNLGGAKTNVSFKSSDEKVATVDSEGKVTAVNVGTATITATAEESEDYLSSSAEFSVRVEDTAVDKVPLTEAGEKYAAPEDNFAPVTSKSSGGSSGGSSGNIKKLVLDFSKVAASNVKPSDLKMTVITGSKFTTASKLKDRNSIKTTGGVKVKVNKKTLIPKITCKKSGTATMTMEDGVTYTINFTVEKPKAQESAKNMNKGSKTEVRTVHDLFGTDIAAGDLTIIKQKHSQAKVSDNSVLVDPKEKDSIKVRYKYLNKKYKITIKVK